MTAQNTSVMSALAEQKVVTEKLVRQDSTTGSIKSCFPLNCTEDLIKMNEKVLPETRSMMVSIISDHKKLQCKILGLFLTDFCNKESASAFN